MNREFMMYTYDVYMMDPLSEVVGHLIMSYI